jgi:hypothetical protein
LCQQRLVVPFLKLLPNRCQPRLKNSIFALFGFGYADTLWLAIAFCLINTIEEIAMTLILPKWTHDLLSLFHAIDLRNA